jgi:uncharacterized protein (DUF1501 family)
MGGSFLFNGLDAWAYESKAKVDGKLIVVFLRGAVDGLNVLVPYGDNRYYSMRPKIAVAKPGQANGALALDADFGLHPSLAPLTKFWQSKNLAFVLNSGSPDPTRSHFEAQDYMETGAPGQRLVTSGWMNRLLEQIPNNQSPVRALNIGSTTPRILQGKATSATYAPTNRKMQTALDNNIVSSRFQEMYSGRNDKLASAYNEGMAARHTISEKLEEEMTAANQGALPANKFNSFGNQLGRLIRKEPNVQVAFVALGGFDTHVNQGAGQGQLANQLNIVGKGLAELIDGLGESFSKTTIVVMSEFGRTAKENGNGGTDHGHGNCMWLLGGKVAGGKLYGRYDSLEQRNLYEGRDMPVHTDFRNVLASLLAEQMKLSKAQLGLIFPNYQAAGNLDLLKG